MPSFRFIFPLILLSCLFGGLQAGSLDSLKKVARSHPQDTVRFDALQKICKHYWNGSVDSALTYGFRERQLAERMGKRRYIGRAMNNIGIAYLLKGSFDSALFYCHRADSIARDVEDGSVRLKLRAGACSNIGLIHRNRGLLDSSEKYFKKALQMARQKGDKALIARQELNMGIVYKAKANFPRAKELYTACIKKAKELDKPEYEAKANTNLGVIHQKLDEYELALKRFKRSIKAFKKMGKKKALAEAFINSGLAYLRLERYKEALEAYRNSIRLFRSIGAPRGEAVVADNIGELHIKIYKNFSDSLPSWYLRSFPSSVKKDPSIILDTAQYYYRSSLRLSKEHGFLKERSLSQYGLGEVMLIRGDTSKAFPYFKKSLELIEGRGMKHHQSDLHQRLAKFHSWAARYEKAFRHHQAYARLRDSVFNEEKSKELGRIEAKHEYEKKRAMQRAKAKAEQKRQRIIIYSMGTGLLLVLFFSGLLINRYRLIHKQKRTIEEKKTELDQAYEVLKERDQEITHSLNYAQSLQQALLPGRKQFGKLVPGDSILFFQPKEKVSGDFYWCDQAPDGSLVWVAADCTGHGIPGAFMSMIGVRLLNEAVLEQGESEPGKILDHVRDGISNAIGGEDDEEGKSDGMDAVACSFSEKDGMLTFAGANNPLYLIRRGGRSEELPEADRSIAEGEVRLYEYKGDKMAVGPGPAERSFQTHRLPVQEGDAVFAFSDGFADQFGGEKGKKFRYGPFKRLLCQLHGKPADEQEREMARIFSEWRQGMEQVDDVCVLGIRFTSG